MVWVGNHYVCTFRQQLFRKYANECASVTLAYQGWRTDEEVNNFSRSGKVSQVRLMPRLGRIGLDICKKDDQNTLRVLHRWHITMTR